VAPQFGDQRVVEAVGFDDDAVGELHCPVWVQGDPWLRRQPSGEHAGGWPREGTGRHRPVPGGVEDGDRSRGSASHGAGTLSVCFEAIGAAGRKGRLGMRIASYNVENLFARAKALNQGSWAAGRPVLQAHAELGQLLQEDSYDDAVKTRILLLLDRLGLTRGDESEFVRLRKIRGRLLRRPKCGPVEVVAAGRASWIGWVELKSEHVDELAMKHTAMVIRDLDADVLGVVEADNRPVLKMFSDALLTQLGAAPYEQVMLVDGNDDRGIDVGILIRGRYPLEHVRTHIFDTDPGGVIFSRDCCEYHLNTPTGQRLAVLVNHLKSKGYSTREGPQGGKRRQRQAIRIAQIYRDLRHDGGPGRRGR